MSSNLFFNNFTNSMEQVLVEDLMIESIAIYGHEVFYCPRVLVGKDDIYGEDPISKYVGSRDIDAYIKSYDSYEGDGSFLSKFNLEIRDQITFSLARRTFANEVGSQFSIERPREGDLIYSAMMKRIFIIKYVNNTPIFYQMGTLQTWDVVCEVFEYSSEHLNTGIYEIDVLEEKYSTDLDSAGVLTTDGYTITDEVNHTVVLGQFDFEKQNNDVLADNDEIEAENTKDNIVDWSQNNPFDDQLI